MTFEEMLAQAFEETFEEHAEHLMTVEKKHRFSLAYRLWKRKLLWDMRRTRIDRRWTLKRSRTVVVSVIAALSILVGGTAYAAARLGRYGFVDKKDYSKLLIDAHPSDKTTFEEYYGLPEEDGWELANYDILDTFTVLNYELGEKKVTFLQHIIHEGSIKNINTEKTDVEMLSLYSENDGFVLELDEECTAIHWIYDGYLFEIVGDLNKDEMINLVHSTKVIDLEKNI